MSATLRPERASDAAAIEALTIDAFREAPYSGHTEQFIVRELRRAGALTLSLVAERAGELVGHLAVSPVHISDGALAWFGLGPVSVAPAHQGQGIGSQLVREALEQLRSRPAQGCVVLGDPGYYGRFGFQPVAGLSLPGVPAAYFQALAFGPGLAQGEVAYHPAFQATA